MFSARRIAQQQQLYIGTINLFIHSIRPFITVLNVNFCFARYTDTHFWCVCVCVFMLACVYVFSLSYSRISLFVPFFCVYRVTIKYIQKMITNEINRKPERETDRSVKNREPEISVFWLCMQCCIIEISLGKC